MLTAARNNQAYLATAVSDTKVLAKSNTYLLADLKDGFPVKVYSLLGRNAADVTATRAIAWLPRSKL